VEGGDVNFRLGPGDEPRLNAFLRTDAVRVADDPYIMTGDLTLENGKADWFRGGATGGDLVAGGLGGSDHSARLELCRGSISSGPGSEMFPFNPEASCRHPEGWVNYGASWCMSLAYFEFDKTRRTTHSRSQQPLNQCIPPTTPPYSPSCQPSPL
jgi:hypothetical protein